MTTTNKTEWAVGDVARDPGDGEVVRVIGPAETRTECLAAPIDLYPVVVLEAGRGGPSGPSALPGERTWRSLNDPDYPFVRAARDGQVAS